jgi:site-specific recombinase XerD
MVEATANLKHKLLMEIMYVSGLRVSEVIKLNKGY